MVAGSAFFKPVDGLVHVGRRPQTVVIGAAQVVLASGRSLAGGFFKPGESLSSILRHALSIHQGYAVPDLGVSLAQFGCLAKSQKGSFRVGRVTVFQNQSEDVPGCRMILASRPLKPFYGFVNVAFIPVVHYLPDSQLELGVRIILFGGVRQPVKGFLFVFGDLEATGRRVGRVDPIKRELGLGIACLGRSHQPPESFRFVSGHVPDTTVELHDSEYRLGL